MKMRGFCVRVHTSTAGYLSPEPVATTRRYPGTATGGDQGFCWIKRETITGASPSPLDPELTTGACRRVRLVELQYPHRPCSASAAGQRLATTGIVPAGCDRTQRTALRPTRDFSRRRSSPCGMRRPARLLTELRVSGVPEQRFAPLIHDAPGT